MDLTLDQALQKGIEAHKAGKVQEADRYYTAILKANPKHPDANHNMGVLAVGVGKVQEALPFFKTALDANSSIAQYWLSYIDALIKLNRMDDAKAVFDRAKRNGVTEADFDKLKEQLRTTNQEPTQHQLQPLINLYAQGQYEQTLSEASQLLIEFPNSGTLFNIIGAANKGQGKLEEAIDAYQKAISIKPDFAEAYNNMGNTLRDQGKLDQASEAYNKAISINPNYAEAYINMGNALKDQGELEEAIKAYQKTVAINPDYADAYNNMGIVLKDLGLIEKAIEAYNKALSIKPDFAEAHNNMGASLNEQGKLKEAIQAYNKALSIKSDYVEAYNNLGIARKDQGKLEEAIEAFKQAISIKPDYAEAHRRLSSIKKYTVNDEHFLQVQEFYKRDNLTEDTKSSLSFALAKMYEDLGQLDQAFKYLSEGNILRKKLLNYSKDRDEKLFSLLKKTLPELYIFSKDLKQASTKPSPIFILGMPRSGTTLIEQIVSSHSDVTGAGELEYVSQYGANLALGSKAINTASLSEFRKKYLSELSRVSNGKRFATDKMPQNFRFIPLICAAFPEAKIIHVQRNAAATCWSNYKQYFPSKGLGYSYDLQDVVSYYRLYSDLMDLWQSEYGNRIYNLDYEKLTTNQKTETKKLIKYLELDWEKTCLLPHTNKRSVRTSSQQQVRQKVYQGSSEVWQKYKLFLDGAFDSLLSL